MASVEKLPSGKYRGIAAWYDMYDKRHKKTFTDPDERRALRLAENYEEQKRASKPTGTTVAQALDAYISALRPVLSPSTLKGYISAADSLKTHHTRFCELTELSAEVAQALVTDLLARDLSPKTVHNYIGVVSAACRAARVPYEAPKLPRWNLPDCYVPSEDDMRRIMDEVRGTRLELPVSLGMFGLRRSEIAGITAEDLTGNILFVHSSKVYGENNELKEKKTTKTRLSTRTVQLPDRIADMLREQGEINMTPAALSSAFHHVVRRLGITMSFKDLRSFFASYCHSVLHLSDIQIQKLGGWSKSMIMRKHYIKSMHDQAAADAVSTALGGF